MPRSVHSMMRHGLISTKAYNATLAKTRSQKSKMAHMDDQSKDDGRGTKGKLEAGEINQHEHQRATAAGVVRKPNATAHGGAPRVGANAINKPANKKKFPPGGTRRQRRHSACAIAHQGHRGAAGTLLRRRRTQGLGEQNTNQERPAEDQHEQKKQEPSRQPSRHHRRRRAGSRLDRGHIGRGHRSAARHPDNPWPNPDPAPKADPRAAAAARAAQRGDRAIAAHRGA